MNPKRTTSLIETHKESLRRYRTELAKNPDSLAYRGMVKNTEEYIEELKEQLQQQQPQAKAKLINEATSTDIRIINLLQAMGWRAGDTLLYQQEYKLTPEQQAQYPGIKAIRPDIILQDLNGTILAVIENKLKDERKALEKTPNVVFGHSETALSVCL